MAYPFNAQALLDFSRPNKVLGPFDGKVAAVIKNWLITTPNQDIIWQPHWTKREVRLRSDVRYGVDDPTLWPQPYIIDYPYLGAIPRKPDDGRDPLSIMWWNPTEHDFVRSPNALVDGLGQLSKARYEKLDILKKQLLERIDQYKTTVSTPNYVLLSMSKAMHHSCIRLGFLSTTLLEMKFGVTEFQRYYLETLGLLDYLVVYKPRMDGAASRPSAVDNRIGVFTVSPRIVQEFYDAGLPVWFIRETRVIAEGPDNPNVLKLVEPRDPSRCLVRADYDPPFPVVFRGTTNDAKKHAAIHSYSRTWMVYRDAFSQEAQEIVAEPIDPFMLSRGPAQYSVTLPMSRLLKERLPRPVPSKTNKPQTREPPAKAHSSAGRDKFTDPDSPLLPPEMPIWANALRSTDRSPHRIVGGAPKGTYALPEPALFVTPADEKKRISFLMTWLKCRVAWLWRLDSGSQVAMKSQMWRDLLGMNYNQIVKEGTSAGKRRDQIHKVMGKDVEKTGVSLSSLSDNEPAVWQGEKLTNNTMPPTNTVREILWELYELNFRFEFLALDLRLSQQDSSLDIATVFPGSEGSVTRVRISSTNYGLVADDWQTRLPSVMALVTCMCSWNVEQVPQTFKAAVGREWSAITKEEMLRLEEAAASFYVQKFFDNFGRAAIVPHRITS